MNDQSTKDKRVLFIVAFNDFQDMEYKKTKQAIKDRGIKVEVCSSSIGTARGKFGGEIKIDILINDVDISVYEAIVFIGGPGAVEYLNSQDAYAVCKQAVAQEKILAAICMAPQILAKSGVIKDKKATVFSSEADQSGVKILQEEGVKYMEKDIVEDGKFITANGPAAAEGFGKVIAKKILQS